MNREDYLNMMGTGWIHKSGVRDPYGFDWEGEFTDNVIKDCGGHFFLTLRSPSYLFDPTNMEKIKRLRECKPTIFSIHRSGKEPREIKIFLHKLMLFYLDCERLKRQMFSYNNLTRRCPQEIVLMIQKEWLKDFNPLMLYRRRNMIYSDKQKRHVEYETFRRRLYGVLPYFDNMIEFKVPVKKNVKYSKDVEKRLKKLERASQRRR